MRFAHMAKKVSESPKLVLSPDASEGERSKHLEWSKGAIVDYYGKIKKQLERQDLVGGEDPEMEKILKEVRKAQDEGLVKDREGIFSLAKELLSSK